MSSLEVDKNIQSILNSIMVQKFDSLEATQKRKEEIILLQQIIKKVKTQINDYMQIYTNKQINYTQDINKTVEAIRKRPTHKNLMYPGIGVGGYCLTKDPLLASWSRKTFFGSSSGIKSMNRMLLNPCR